MGHGMASVQVMSVHALMLTQSSCQALSCHCAEVSFVGRLTEQKGVDLILQVRIIGRTEGHNILKMLHIRSRVVFSLLAGV